MNLKFTDDLLLGNPLIDKQHQEWFRRANHFWEAARRGKGREKLLEVFMFIENYVKKHFADEERLQEESSYPGLDTHKKQHAEFLERIKKLRLNLDRKGPDYSTAIETLNSMLEWAVSHISSVDRELAKYLKAR